MGVTEFSPGEGIPSEGDQPVLLYGDHPLGHVVVDLLHDVVQGLHRQQGQPCQREHPQQQGTAPGRGRFAG